MLSAKKRYFVLSCIVMSTYFGNCYAGPPFNTDDPQPVQLKHWEYYISSVTTFQAHEWSGTLPHFEVNYGVVPNVQLHVLLPVNYDYSATGGFNAGYSYTEVGVKYCFIPETESFPQIGTFPIVEIPTLKNARFGDGNVQLFIPLWIQKSWNKLTTYGGGGYSIRPGAANKNSVFVGWEVQYDFSPIVTLGSELYYHSSEAVDLKPVMAFNVGGSINFSQRTHFIFSVGHSLINESFFSSYMGILWTI